MQINIMEKPNTTAATSKATDKAGQLKSKDITSKDFSKALSDCEGETEKEGKAENKSKEDGNSKEAAATAGSLLIQIPVVPTAVLMTARGILLPAVKAVSIVEDAVTPQAGELPDFSSNPQQPQTPYSTMEPGFSRIIMVNPKAVSAQSETSAKDGITAVTGEKTTLKQPVFDNALKTVSDGTEISAKVMAKNVPVNEATIKQNISVDIKTAASFQEKTKVSADAPIITKAVITAATDEKSNAKSNIPNNQPLSEAVVVKPVKFETASAEQKSSSDSKSTDSHSKDDFSSAVVTSQTQLSGTESLKSGSDTLKAAVSNQITDAAKQAVDTGRTEVKIHLSPEDLGGISIKIVSNNGALTVSISADNERTGQLIASSMPQLSKSMQEQGITMQKSEVSYAGSQLDTSSQGQQSGHFSQSGWNNPNNQFGSGRDGDLPKWTVAMDTHGETVSDAATMAKEKVQSVKNIEDSAMSMLV